MNAGHLLICINLIEPRFDFGSMKFVAQVLWENVRKVVIKFPISAISQYIILLTRLATKLTIIDYIIVVSLNNWVDCITGGLVFFFEILLKEAAEFGSQMEEVVGVHKRIMRNLIGNFLR